MGKLRIPTGGVDDVGGPNLDSRLHRHPDLGIDPSSPQVRVLDRTTRQRSALPNCPNLANHAK